MMTFIDITSGIFAILAVLLLAVISAWLMLVLFVKLVDWLMERN